MPPLGGDTGRKHEHMFAICGGFVLFCPDMSARFVLLYGHNRGRGTLYLSEGSALRPGEVATSHGYMDGEVTMPNLGDSDLGGFRSLDLNMVRDREAARREAAERAAERRAMAELERNEREMLRAMGKTPGTRKARNPRVKVNPRDVVPYVRGHVVLKGNPQRGKPKTAESSARVFRSVGLDERYMRPNGGITVTGTPSRLLGDSPTDAMPTYAEACADVAARWTRKAGRTWTPRR